MYGFAANALTDPALDITMGRTELTSLRGLTPQTLGGYLSQFADGQYANVAPIFWLMRNRDDVLSAVWDKRLRKSRRYVRQYRIDRVPDDQLTPGEQRRAAAHEQYLRQFYSSLTASSLEDPQIIGGLPTAVGNALDCLAMRYSFQAKKWTQKNGRWHCHLTFVPLWNFRRYEGQLHLIYQGQQLPIQADQWLIARSNRAIMEAASVLVLLKRLPAQQFARLLERWGVPNPVGYMDADPDGEPFRQFKQALDGYIAGSSLAISSTQAKVESLTTDTRVGANLHRPWIDRCDRILTIQCLGGELGTMAAAGTGTLAGGAQAEDTDELISDDCDQVSEWFNEQLDRQAIRLQFGDEEPLAWLVIEKPDAQDLKLRLQIYKEATNLGVAAAQSDFREEFSIREPAAGEPVLQLVDPYADRLGDGEAQPLEPDGEAAAAAANAPRGWLHQVHATQQRLLPAANAAAGAGRQAAQQAQADLRAYEERVIASGEVAAAELAMVQPLLDRLASAPNVDAASRRLTAYEVPAEARQAYAELLQRITFAAVMRGLVLDRPLEAQNARLRERLASAWRKVLPRWAAPVSKFQFPVSSNNAAVPDFAPLPFDEAMAYWANLPLITDTEDANALWEESGRYGLRVANITEPYLLGQIRDVLVRATAGEITLAQAAAELEDRFGLGSAHAETVVRTNVQNAFAWGHWQQLTDPDVAEAFPYLGFDVTVDDRSSDICPPLQGTVYPRQHPIWQTLYPPNHFRCRTTVYAVSEFDPEADDLTEEWPRQEDGTRLEPATTFARNIGQGPLSEVLPDA